MIDFSRTQPSRLTHNSKLQNSNQKCLNCARCPFADVLLAAAGAAVRAGGGVGAGGREAAVLRQPRGGLPALPVHGFRGGAGQRDGAQLGGGGRRGRSPDGSGFLRRRRLVALRRVGPGRQRGDKLTEGGDECKHSETLVVRTKIHIRCKVKRCVCRILIGLSSLITLNVCVDGQSGSMGQSSPISIWSHDSLAFTSGEHGWQ